MNLDDIKRLIERAKTNKLSLTEDDFGVYDSGFDATEMDSTALAAAMNDISDDGEEFVPLGNSEHEENLDTDALKADLTKLDRRYKHEKRFGAGSLNETEPEAGQVDRRYKHKSNTGSINEVGPSEDNDADPDNFHFDTTNLYKYFLDALWQLKWYDEAVAAQVLEKAFLRDWSVSKKTSTATQMAEGPIDRPKDANGQDITNKARVKHIETGAIGNVLHPGVDEQGRQTIHVTWLPIGPGAQGPQQAVLPTEIVVDDDTRIVREDDLEESSSRSLANGRGANGRPETFPGYFERDYTEGGSVDYTENSFNDLEEEEVDESSSRSFANGKSANAKPEAFPSQFKREGLNEGFDFSREEVTHQNQQTTEPFEPAQDYVGKEINIKNHNNVWELCSYSKQRLNSILKSLSEELAAKRVQNNVVAADDYLDTTWIFDILGVDDTKVYLEFTGTAK